MHGQIGEENDHVILDANNETRVVFVATGNDADVVAHGEVFLELVSLEFECVFQVFVFREDGDFVAVDCHDFTAQMDQFAFAHFDSVARRKVVCRFFFSRRYRYLHNPFQKKIKIKIKLIQELTIKNKV